MTSCQVNQLGIQTLMGGSEEQGQWKANQGALKLVDMQRARVLCIYIFNALVCNFNVRVKSAVLLFF